MTAEELLRRYAAGERDFTEANLDGAYVEGSSIYNAFIEHEFDIIDGIIQIQKDAPWW